MELPQISRTNFNPISRAIPLAGAGIKISTPTPKLFTPVKTQFTTLPIQQKLEIPKSAPKLIVQQKLATIPKTVVQPTPKISRAPTGYLAPVSKSSFLQRSAFIPATPRPTIPKLAVDPSLPRAPPQIPVFTPAIEQATPELSTQAILMPFAPPILGEKTMAFPLAALAGQALGAVGGAIGKGISGGQGKSNVLSVGKKYILRQNAATGRMSVSSRTPRRRYFGRRSGGSKMDKLMELAILKAVMKG